MSKPDRDHIELAQTFERFATRFKPDLFGDDDQRVGPLISLAECKTIHLALLNFEPIRS